MRLLFVGFDHTALYRSSDLPGVAWAAGEERDVPEAVGARLLADFPGAFVACGGTLPVVTPTMEAPPVDRMVHTPNRRRK